MNYFLDTNIIIILFEGRKDDKFPAYQEQVAIVIHNPR